MTIDQSSEQTKAEKEEVVSEPEWPDGGEVVMANKENEEVKLTPRVGSNKGGRPSKRALWAKSLTQRSSR